MTAEERGPRRLSESPGAAGEVLRRALSEQELAAPLPRFTQLQARRQTRSRRFTAALLAAAAVVLGVGLRTLRPSEPPLTVRAEPAMAPTPARVSSFAAAAPVAEPTAPSAPEPPVRRDDVTAKSRAPAVAPSAPRGVEGALVPAVKAAPDAQSGGAKSCAELARGGAVESAMTCYEALSSGSGVSAELALFEQARLAGKALRQPARALSLLDAYRARFPNGSLRAEVMLARIEWSLAAGDSALARAAVDEALASGLLAERRAELERLRASFAADSPATGSP